MRRYDRIRDRAMRRDMRSRDARGRYTRDRAYRNEMHDMTRGRDRSMMDYARNRDYRGTRDREYDARNADYNYAEYDMARGRRDYEPTREYDMASRSMRDGHYPMEFHGQYGDMPFYVRGGRDYNYDYGYDYGYGRDYGEMKLDKEELEDWYEDLMEEIEPQYKSLYTKQNIEDIAKQMQIEFDKFTPLDLVVTTTMLATDYPKSIGQADIHKMVVAGKEWLCDKDSKLKYGEKLSAYYDNVVNG